jgi:hypothetical protein
MSAIPIQLVVQLALLGVRTPTLYTLPLSEADFSLGRLTWSADTSATRHALGRPSSIRHYDDRIDDELLHLTDWTYPGLRLTFAESGHLRVVRITGRRWSTHRGLQVGDVVDRIVALYGQPAQRAGAQPDYHMDAALYYHIPPAPPSRLGMFVQFAQGRVTAIVFGVIVEGD